MSGSIDLILAVAFVAYLVWVGKMFWEIRAITKRTKETMARTERTMAETERKVAETKRLRQEMPIAERLERFRTQCAVDKARSDTEARIVGGLLTGSGTVMGKPFIVLWPEGFPDGMDEEQMMAYGRKLLAQSLEGGA